MAILSLVLVLGSAELVLRLAGYGNPAGFFIPWRASGRTFHLTNQHYCEHFVPKELSRTPEPCAPALTNMGNYYAKQKQRELAALFRPSRR